MAAAERLKDGAADNDLIDRIRSDPAFPPLDFERVLDPRRFIGRSARQVDEFVAQRDRADPPALSRSPPGGRGFRGARLTRNASRLDFGRSEPRKTRPLSDSRGLMLAGLA